MIKVTEKIANITTKRKTDGLKLTFSNLAVNELNQSK